MIDLYAIIKKTKKTVFLNNPLAKANTIDKLVFLASIPKLTTKSQLCLPVSSKLPPDFSCTSATRALVPFL